MTVQAGQEAPEFDLPAAGGGRARLAEFKGKPLVLYFYPKDNTPGCTTEAMQFRDHHKEFVKNGAVVFGVSRDNMASHDKFKQSLELPFELIADTESVRAGYPGVEVDHRAYHSGPAASLIQASRDARMLVVGCRGLGGIQEMVLGSVSDQCVRHAHCPVLVARQP